MPKQNRLTLILTITLTIIIGILLFCFRPSYQSLLQHCTLIFSNGVVLHNVPLAITSQQQHQGLSNRDDIGTSMLFHFSQPQHLSFWMRDTRMPLSIGFFSAQGELLQIDDMQPHSDVNHVSQQLTTDALELPQGAFAKFNLTINTRLTQRICE